VVVVDVVLESAGFHMLKRQNVGSVILMDSGPVLQKCSLYKQFEFFSTYLSHTAEYNAT
jgi:hypothetical protein